MLQVDDLVTHYSGIAALRGVSISVADGEMVALIGPNGAGKSTLLNSISGVVKATSGAIRFGGDDILGRSPWSIARRGLLQVPEGRQVHADMSVRENLQIGASALAGRPLTHDLANIFELFPILADRQDQLAGSLSGGQQQMLAIGRALMGAPRLLLLDEPSLGLAPVVVRQVFEVLKRLNTQGLTILLVEQNARQALEATSRTYVIERGCVAISGASASLVHDPSVAKHYLGQGAVTGRTPATNGRKT